jgi:long-chain fatty acid transport protein
VFAGVALAASVGAAPALQAQGSGVDQHSACMTGRVGAGTASPCADGSAIYFSPGGLAFQPSMLGANLTVIRTSNDFIYDRAAAPTASRGPATATVPALFGSYRINERWAAGLGVFAPYGLGIEWEPEGFEGRFSSYDTALRGIYIQPTVAYQVVPGLISVGAGVDFVRGSVELNQRADLAAVPLPAGPTTPPGATFANLGIPFGTDFADVNLKGDGSAVTGHVGVVVRASDRLSLGARYLHSARVDLDGDATFEMVPTNLTLAPGNPLNPAASIPVDALVASRFQAGQALANQGITSSIEFPAQAVFGVSVRPAPQLDLMVDYQWTGWSSFDQLAVDFQEAGADTVLTLGYKDTNTFRFAAEYASSQALMLRAGFRYNDAATQIGTPLLPENERNYYTAGIGYRFRNGLGIDAAYQYIDQADRRGRVRPGGIDPEESVGLYTAEASTFGVTLSYRFGRMMDPAAAQ